MPAVTLQNSTVHSSQNCGVLTELAAETLSVVTRVRLALLLLRVEALRDPVVGRHLDQPGAEQHHDEVDDAEGEEHPGDGRAAGHRRRGGGVEAAVEEGEQAALDGRRDERAPAEAHDRQAGRQSRPVGEPA